MTTVARLETEVSKKLFMTMIWQSLLAALVAARERIIKRITNK
jgi:hypothetical protein